MSTALIPDYLSSLILVRPTSGGYTKTLTVAAAVGDSSIEVGDDNTTGLTPGMVLLLSDGEQMERVTVDTVVLDMGDPTGEVTLKEKLLRPHAVGAAVRGATAYDLGEPLQDGVSVTIAGSKEDVAVATRKTPWASFVNAPAISVTAAMPYCTPEMFALALGLDPAAVSGAGSNASPRQWASDLADLGRDGDQCLVATGVLKNGNVVRVEIYAVSATYVGFSWTAKRPTQNGVPLSWTGKGGVKLAESAIDFTPASTWRGDVGDAFNFLLDAGQLVPPDTGTLSTTTTALEPKGEVVLALTAVTNIVKGTVLRLTDVSGRVQHVMAESVASLNVTCKTPLIRDLPSGSTAVIVGRERMTPIADAGHQLAIAGSESAIQADDYRFPIMTEVTDLVASATYPALRGDLTAILLQAGVDPAQVNDGQVYLNENLGTLRLPGWYARFQLSSGDIGWFLYGGCVMPGENVAIALNTQGATTPISIVAQPADELRMLVGPDL